MREQSKLIIPVSIFKYRTVAAILTGILTAEIALDEIRFGKKNFLRRMWI
jgi:hypothetical protein